MNAKRPVVIYGASGSTGRLVAEYLREYSIPFVAAGRNKDRVQEVMSKVPGIETADYEIAEVDGSVESLTRLFEGRRVVCNVVGPFLRYAPAVVEAALRAGCHYLDTAGEQSHMLSLLDEWGPKFAEAGLVASTAVSIQYALHDIAARICLETPGVDTLELGSYANAIPTVGSTQSIFDVIRAQAHYLEDGRLRKYDGVVVQDLVVPGSGYVVTGTNWGGTAMPVFFRDDRRVRNCRMFVAMHNQDIWRRVVDLERLFKVSLQWLPEETLYPVLDRMAAGMTADSPPRENRQIQRSVDWCTARGNTATARVVIHSSTGYQMTGLMQAYTAMRLLGSTHNGTGFRSPAELVGHRELMGALESYGFARITEESAA
ncbi:saccharopine dehydrogenase family protein [Streptomyces sp. NPDC058464]|uniref:saccharopine dehydrogenase family protein n=1 Tax=Streptomyces sp. NPDC058464 TaxID=3346511 RepID=UPI003657EAB0